MLTLFHLSLVLSTLLLVLWLPEARPLRVPTTPYTDQVPGTSGLRKKVSVMESSSNYLENLVQCYLDVQLKSDDKHKDSLLVCGDGRYWNDAAIEKIINVCVGNNVSNVYVPKSSIMTTPAASSFIRDKRCNCGGAIILTASHNPGGKHGDFGIKFNLGRGQPADENFTGLIASGTKTIDFFNSPDDQRDVDTLASIDWTSGSVGETYTVQNTKITIVDQFDSYVDALSKFYDLKSLSTYAKSNLSILYDGMNGGGGPFAKKVLGGMLGLPLSSFTRCNPLPDFDGIHPDPNLKYGEELVSSMGLNPNGTPDNSKTSPFDLGAANDADGDRNIIFGKGFFVTPSDSVAVIADWWQRIGDGTPLKGVARSMPTSGGK